MRLSLQTDYALRTLIFLAAEPGRASVAKIASFYGISRDHVAKVVQHLARLQFIRSMRGVGGGIQLRLRPDQIRVGEVVLAFEGNMHLLECVATEKVCVIQPGCRLRGVLAEAERLQMEYLHGIRLSDIVETGTSLVQLTLPSNVEPSKPQANKRRPRGVKSAPRSRSPSE